MTQPLCPTDGVPVDSCSCPRPSVPQIPQAPMTGDMLRGIAARYDLDVIARQRLYSSPYWPAFARAYRDENWTALEGMLVSQGICTTVHIELVKL